MYLVVLIHPVFTRMFLVFFLFSGLLFQVFSNQEVLRFSFIPDPTAEIETQSVTKANICHSVEGSIHEYTEFNIVTLVQPTADDLPLYITHDHTFNPASDVTISGEVVDCGAEHTSEINDNQKGESILAPVDQLPIVEETTSVDQSPAEADATNQSIKFHMEIQLPEPVVDNPVEADQLNGIQLHYESDSSEYLNQCDEEMVGIDFDETHPSDMDDDIDEGQDAAASEVYEPGHQFEGFPKVLVKDAKVMVRGSSLWDLLSRFFRMDCDICQESR